MPKQFKIGDHVRWNSEAGYVTGTIVKIHHRSFNYKGYTHHATKDDPQYEIKSDNGPFGGTQGKSTAKDQ